MSEEELLDYEDEEEVPKVVEVEEEEDKYMDISQMTTQDKKEGKEKGSYISVHSSGFRDFLLKPEILRALNDCGFEHPSEVQHECLPQAMVGTDLICQAKSGMGKTAVFVLATLHQIDFASISDKVIVLVMCHTRELAFQISREYQRFTKYLPGVKVSVFFGGLPVQKDIAILQNDCPHIVVGTPGRILELSRKRKLNYDGLKHIVLDECDKMLSSLDMRKDVQDIFRFTPHCKQVLMFSATLPKEIRQTCKMFMQCPLEIYVDDETKLTLHGLLQYYFRLEEHEKNAKLFEIMDAYEFNQMIIFVNTIQRCDALTRILLEQGFPASCIHRGMSQEDRLKRYKAFKEFKKRILVATDLFGRGVDIEKVNIVLNYDMSQDSDTYLHRVARTGRFGTKGLAITLVSNNNDIEVLNDVIDRFNENIDELPDSIDKNTYMEKI